MSLTCLTSQRFIRAQSLKRVHWVFVHESKVLNKFFHTGHLVLFKQNKVNFLSQEIIFRKYATETPSVSRALGASNVNNQAENKNEKYIDRCYDVDSVEHEDREEEEIRKREKIFEEIADGSADVLEKLKLLEFEIAVLRERGNAVVNNPSKSQWMELLKNFDSTPSKKIKLLSFMALNEKLEFYNSKKKNIKHFLREKNKAESGFHYYGLAGHSIIPRLIDNSLNKLIGLRQLIANEKIVIDCSYDKLMNERCQKNLAKQIQMCILEMKSHQYPCQLAFCNLDQNSPFGEIVEKYVGHMFNKDFCCDVSARSPSDLYPKKKLVYLSPDAPNNLIEINKEDIYIIGGYVDKGFSLKASLAKAKKEKLRVARFPIDLYLFWKQGNKNLPINIVLKILLNMMFYNDWNIALKCIANRSKSDTFRKNLIVSNEVEELESILQTSNFNK